MRVSTGRIMQDAGDVSRGIKILQISFLTLFKWTSVTETAFCSVYRITSAASLLSDSQDRLVAIMIQEKTWLIDIIIER
jgi:hypothetical protein